MSGRWAPPPATTMTTETTPTNIASIVATKTSPTSTPSEDGAADVEWVSWTGADTATTRNGTRGITGNAESRTLETIVNRRSRAAALRRAAVGARTAAAVLCLVSLAVLAADRRKGWADDSFSQYSQLRYCETVNAIGFVYSVFQLYAQVLLMREEKHLIPRPEGNFFDFFMDQVLAYLLISSSSSATALVSDWITNWGSDPFPSMANGAIAVSFLAFSAFAVSSLISACNLFTRDF